MYLRESISSNLEYFGIESRSDEEVEFDDHNLTYLESYSKMSVSVRKLYIEGAFVVLSKSFKLPNQLKTLNLFCKTDDEPNIEYFKFYIPCNPELQEYIYFTGN